MLLSITDLVQNNNLLQNFMMSNSDTESADFEFVGSNFRKTLSDVFISLVSSITNPILSTIFTLILFLSMFWADVSTTILVKYIVSSLKTKMSKQASKPASATQRIITIHDFCVMLS